MAIVWRKRGSDLVKYNTKTKEVIEDNLTLRQSRFIDKQQKHSKAVIKDNKINKITEKEEVKELIKDNKIRTGLIIKANNLLLSQHVQNRHFHDAKRELNDRGIQYLRRTKTQATISKDSIKFLNNFKRLNKHIKTFNDEKLEEYCNNIVMRARLMAPNSQLSKYSRNKLRNSIRTRKLKSGERKISFGALATRKRGPEEKNPSMMQYGLFQEGAWFRKIVKKIDEDNAIASYPSTNYSTINKRRFAKEGSFMRFRDNRTKKWVTISAKGRINYVDSIGSGPIGKKTTHFIGRAFAQESEKFFKKERLKTGFETEICKTLGIKKGTTNKSVKEQPKISKEKISDPFAELAKNIASGWGKKK
ncbi:MAG: hypothetical protein WC444_05545 [Candidatus Paceibacterota bacterium]